MLRALVVQSTRRPSPHSFSPLHRSLVLSQTLCLGFSNNERHYYSKRGRGVVYAGLSAASLWLLKHDAAAEEQTAVALPPTSKLLTTEKRKVTFWNLLIVSYRDVFYLLGAALSLLASTLASLAMPKGVAVLIQALKTMQPVRMPLGLSPATYFIVVFLFHSVTKFVSLSLLSEHTEMMCARIQTALFGRMLRMDMSEFDETQTGVLVDRLGSDVEDVRVMVKHSMTLGLRSVFTVVGNVAALIAISPHLTGAMAVTLPLIIGAGSLYGRYLRALSKSVREEQAETLALAQESLSNIRTVRSFANETLEERQFAGRMDRVHAKAAKLGSYVGLFHTLAALSVSAVVGLTLLVGHALVDSLPGGHGALTSFMMYSLRVQGALGQVSVLSGEMGRGRVALERILDLLNSESVIPSRGGVVPSVCRGKLELINVSFAYPSRPGAPVLQNCTFKLLPNTVTALVGPSGVGKSTVAWLLERFYDPQQGAVLMDDQDITTIDPSWLRSSIGVVSQEPVLFSGTIYDNILYGKPGASRAEVLSAAETANCTRFISEFPQGFDTRVGERGMALSGGQKQRIAIARAALKNPAVLILDEATSALDSVSEQAVQQALERVMKGRTTLVVAHRLSTIQSADNIVVLGGGGVQQQGSHEDLIKQKEGFYWAMHRQGIKARTD